MGRSLTIALFIVLSIALALSACGRQFEPPPDVVALESVSPVEAFAGTRVTLSGRNFEQPPEANLVFFGSTAAEIDTSNSKVADGVLVVEVPALAGINQKYTLTVSTSTGQAGLSEAFTYKGPGHPLAEQVHHLLPIEASPNTIAVVLPDERMLQLNPALVTNTSSRTISLMDLDTGWHLDLGFPGQPLSAVLLPWKDEPLGVGEEPDPALDAWRDDDCFEIHQYAIYATVIEVGVPDHFGGSSLRTEARSKKLSFVVPAAGDESAACRAKWERQATGGTWFQPLLGDLPDSAKLAFPEPVSGDEAWMPSQLKLLCLGLDPNGDYQASDCQERVLAVTDYYRPLLGFVRVRPVSDNDLRFRLEPPLPITLDTAGSGCADAVVGRVLDLTHVPGEQALLAVAEGRPEIWRIDLGSDANGDLTTETRLIWPRAELLADGVDVSGIGWQTEAVDPQTACGLRFTALAAGVLTDSREVYLADRTTGRVIEALYATNLLGFPNLEALLPKRALSLGSPVFALQAALVQSPPDPDREFLYAATEDGLALIESGGSYQSPLTEIGFIGLPASRGGPGSLARYGHSATDSTDRVALADAARNQLFVLQAGDLDEAMLPFPAGSVRPQVAASQWEDRLYLADPLSNTIRLIDQNTGLQAGKFLVRGDQAFGATGLQCLHQWGSDLLLVPMANEILDPSAEHKTFDRIVVRRAENLDQLDLLIDGFRGSNPVDDQSAEDYQAHNFNEALVAQDSGLIYLVQYPDPDVAGSGVIWPAAIDPFGTLDQILLDGGDFPQAALGIQASGRPLPAWVDLVRLSSDEKLLVAFGVHLEDGNPVGRILIYPASDFTAEADYDIQLPPPVPLLVKDLAVWSKGSRTVLFFSLPDTGMVLALQPGEGGATIEKYIETTGVPRWLTFSPDRQRLYVTHRAEGKLSVIDTGCEPIVFCPEYECQPGFTCRAGACQPPGGCYADYLCDQDTDCPGASTCLAEIGTCFPEDLGEVLWCDPGFTCGMPFGDCLPEPCESLLITLPVDLYPDKVVFHPSGKSAYLTHEGSNVITVIE